MTTIQYSNKSLSLMQAPYLDTVHVRIGDTVEEINGNVYRALATDTSGSMYQIYWTRLTADNEVADWDAYTVLGQ